MKKMFLILAMVFAMSCGVFAQGFDGMFNDYNDPYNRISDLDDIGFSMPTAPLGSNQNEPVPLGSGLLILTALGVGYSIKNRK